MKPLKGKRIQKTGNVYEMATEIVDIPRISLKKLNKSSGEDRVDSLFVK